MAIPHRITIITTSILLLLLLAISLTASFTSQTQPKPSPQISITQGQNQGQSDPNLTPQKAEINNSEFNRVDIIPAPTDTPQNPDTAPTPTPQVQEASPITEIPIIGLLYAHSSGPTHCRGALIQKLFIPSPPPSIYSANGTCISLPSAARCGVFIAPKEARCEADLFSMEDCVDTEETYVNTVVFMPEERAVGGLWGSLRVRCGVGVGGV